MLLRLGYNPVGEHLHSMDKALGSVPSLVKQRDRMPIARNLLKQN